MSKKIDDLVAKTTLELLHRLFHAIMEERKALYEAEEYRPELTALPPAHPLLELEKILRNHNVEIDDE